MIFHIHCSNASINLFQFICIPIEGSWIRGDAVVFRLWTRLPSSWRAHTITCWLAATSAAPDLFSLLASFTTASAKKKRVSWLTTIWITPKHSQDRKWQFHFDINPTLKQNHKSGHSENSQSKHVLQGKSFIAISQTQLSKAHKKQMPSSYYR